ncbi:MAG: DNA gyrase inhibitor YacG [Acidobacteria bacterium]|nr:DNA gyrase inhibitor YacG [Acidobacteriota bacterium]
MMVRCPICKTEVRWEDNPMRPFCSERCKLIDLGHWADESYSVGREPAPSTSTPVGEAEFQPAGDDTREGTARRPDPDSGRTRV